MELKTTEEFVREAHSAACSTWKTKIEKEFPELFKTELEVGKWYKGSVDFESIIFITEIENAGHHNRVYYYGFINNTYRKGDYIANKAHEASLIPASTAEIESALIAEAKKRFGEDWENAKLKECLYHGCENYINVLGFHTVVDEYRIWNRNAMIFNNGVWAEPLPEEKTTISKEKALKIIAEKLKVSPESIEIN